MPITNESDQIAPHLIEVGERQRSETKLAGLIDSIRLYGILVPLIVRREWEHESDGIQHIILVAGRRRLACAIELDLATVPIRYYETLDPVEAKIIELEENIKREDLPWRDQVRAIGDFDKLKREGDPEWNATKTADALSYSPRQIQYILTVFGSLESPTIAAADNLAHAIGILQRISERRTASIVDEMLRAPSANASVEIVTTTEEQNLTGNFPHVAVSEYVPVIDVSPGLVYTVSQPPPTPIPPILVADFISWSASYSGPKFNLIHCDFPYGVHAADATIEHYENTKELFWDLTSALTSNIDKLLSYSAHVMFWLSFEYYEQVKIKLSAAGLHVINRPLIWVRSDSRGAAPGIRGTQPRHSYEIALLCYRGNRPLVKQGTDSYSAQTVTNPIHPTQKPESMLKHFLSMLVDNVTDFLDPTCGSGSALRAADDLGARLVLGLEKDPDYASAANAAMLRARQLRKASADFAKQNQNQEEQLPLPIEL